MSRARQARRRAGRLGAVASARATIDKTVEPEHRAEIKAKLANFVRAPWFAPPFGGPRAHQPAARRLRRDGDGAEGRAAAARLPAARPVRHRHRFPRLCRAAPAQFAARGDRDRASPDPRLPGSGRRRRGGSPTPPSSPSPRARRRASPAPSRPSRWRARPLPRRARPAPGRAAPPSSPAPCRSTRALGEAEEAVLIDGSVLANAPVRAGRRGAREAAGAARGRPALRLYRSQARHEERAARRRAARAEPPGFFATIFGALSDIPREQPIRDNLEAIERMSARIRRLRRIVEAMRPGGRGGDRARGRLELLPRPARRRRGSPPGAPRRTDLAAREAGYAYAAYGQLKIADRGRGDRPTCIFRLGGGGDSARRRERCARRSGAQVRDAGLADAGRGDRARARATDVIRFLVDFDRHLPHPAAALRRPPAHRDGGRRWRRRATSRSRCCASLHGLIARYRDREPSRPTKPTARAFAARRGGSRRARSPRWPDCSISARSTTRPTSALSEALRRLPKARPARADPRLSRLSLLRHRHPAAAAGRGARRVRSDQGRPDLAQRRGRDPQGRRRRRR